MAGPTVGPTTSLFKGSCGTSSLPRCVCVQTADQLRHFVRVRLKESTHWDPVKFCGGTIKMARCHSVECSPMGDPRVL
eukprot:4086330-Pyramimonas_sp.AAC.1